jgi:hypothetical protein
MVIPNLIKNLKKIEKNLKKILYIGKKNLKKILKKFKKNSIAIYYIYKYVYNMAWVG